MALGTVFLPTIVYNIRISISKADLIKGEKEENENKEKGGEGGKEEPQREEEKDEAKEKKKEEKEAIILITRNCQCRKKIENMCRQRRSRISNIKKRVTIAIFKDFFFRKNI